MTLSRTRPPRIPSLARALDAPLWDRSQARMRERYGFDLAAMDAQQRAEKRLSNADDADGHLLLASVLSLRGDSSRALAETRRALEMAPDSARAHTTLAALLVNSGDVPNGLDHALRAASLDDKDPQILYNLGLAEHVSGDRERADIAFRAAADLIGLTPPSRWTPWRR